MSADPRYPIGKYERKDTLTAEDRRSAIEAVAATPARLREAVQGLSEEQLDTPYRQGGWTLRQVVHHLPDSHMNAYTRFKLALTEDTPEVKPYDEAKWAELIDSQETPIATSLTLLDSVHDRWVRILRSLGAEDFAKAVRHSEHGVINLDALLGLYAWHGRHHVGHITALRQSQGW
ncbi:MAG: YfiT family bacillithiol transferase [Thermoanaerobaculia bacterium]